MGYTVAWAMAGLACRLTLACIFTGAALHAVLDWPRFTAIVLNYRLAPYRAGRVAAFLLPPAQAVTAVLLVAGQPAGSALALVLLGLFAGAIALNVARGRTAIECGCGGAAGQRLSWWLVARNGALGLLVGVGFFAPTPAVQDAAILVGVGGAAAFLVTLYFAVGQMLANAQAFAARARA